MRLEAHDGEIDNETSGTLAARLKNGADYVYQIEMYVQLWERDIRHARRFYAFDDGVFAVYGRGDNGEMHYIGRDQHWDGEWQLPFLYPNTTGIAVAMIGREVRDFAEAAQWADKALHGSNIATAIVIDEDGILAAWEADLKGVTLVSKGPRPLPKRSAA